jgi:hypothetical protein
VGSVGVPLRIGCPLKTERVCVVNGVRLIICARLVRWRRVAFCCWPSAWLSSLHSIACLSRFVNVSPLIISMSSCKLQIFRHIYMPETTLTPRDPSVVALVNDFYDSVGGETRFRSYPFERQMYLVDKYVYRTIQWVDVRRVVIYKTQSPKS